MNIFSANKVATLRSVDILCLLNYITAMIQATKGRVLVNPISGFEHAEVMCDTDGYTWGVQVVRYPNFFLGNGSR